MPSPEVAGTIALGIDDPWTSTAHARLVRDRARLAPAVH